MVVDIHKERHCGFSLYGVLGEHASVELYEPTNGLNKP
jgi:hypothetical protein